MSTKPSTKPPQPRAGFSKTSRAIWSTDLSATDKLVYCVVRSYQFENGIGECRPTLDTIAADASLGSSAARRSVRRLVAAGWLKIERQGRWKGTATVYDVMERVPEKYPQDVKPPTKGVVGTPLKGALGTPFKAVKGCRRDTPIEALENRIKEKKKSGRASNALPVSDTPVSILPNGSALEGEEAALQAAFEIDFAAFLTSVSPEEWARVRQRILDNLPRLIALGFKGEKEYRGHIDVMVRDHFAEAFCERQMDIKSREGMTDEINLRRNVRPVPDEVRADAQFGAGRPLAKGALHEATS